MSIESMVLPNHLILCHPLLLLLSIFPSIRVFSNESTLCIRWPNYWSFSISPSNEYSELISFKIDWCDLAVQGDSQESSQFSSVQSLSCVWLFVIPWIAARQASLPITNSQSLLKLMSIESMMPSSHLILCCPLLLPPPIFPSIRVFSNESALRMRWPKYWSFSFSISPSNEHPGLTPLGWLDLLAVQGTLKSLLQHHSSKASIFFFCALLSSQSNSHIHTWPQHHNSKISILWCSAFFMVQISHSYMTTGKTTALTMLSLLFNTLSRFVTRFLPRSKCLLISWLQSMSIVILKPKGKKENLSLVPLFPHLFAMKWWDQMPWS